MQQLLKNWLSRNNNSSLSLTSPATAGLVCLLIFVNSNVIAQANLVPNPSFEIHTNCPTGPSQIAYATPWYDAFNPINGSFEVDYFNGCSTGFFSAPYQDTFNFQYAHTGIAFAGILTYNQPGNNYREYLQVELNSPLISNQCYYIEFFVNLPNAGQKFASNNLGCALTTNPISNTTIGTVINAVPNILLYSNPIITDSMNWVKISGIYQSTGSENYLTIGNFFDDPNTDTLDVGFSSYPAAYYFIDDVSVTEVLGPTWSYNDTNIVIGDSIFIGNLMSGLNCTWYLNGATISNAPGFYVSPTENSSYVIEMNICGNLFYDTVNVNVQLINVPEISTTAFEANIYPNPTPGEFSLELPKEVGGWQVTIKDVEGRIILVQKVTEKTTLTKLIPEAENGVYLVYITKSFTNATVVKKLVIQK